MTDASNHRQAKTTEIRVLVCEHFFEEAQAALSELDLEDVDCAPYPARCGKPPITREELETAGGQSAPAARTVVLGGCCVNGLESCSSEHPVLSINQKPQCFEWIAGRTFVENQVRQGAFLATPGWLANWRQWMDEAGFDRETAGSFFRESVTRIVLLDTDTDPDADQKLKDFGHFVDRPVFTVPVGIDVFKVFLHRRILVERQELSRQRAEESERRYRQEQADFAMALDLLSQLPTASSEHEAFEKTAEVFNMLFAPQRIVYAEIEANTSSRVWLLSGHHDGFDPTNEGHRFAVALQTERLIRSDHGFMLRMSSRENQIRGLGIEGIAFPEYLDRYAHVAQTAADVCGMAIDNARSYERLKASESRLRDMATTDSLTGVPNRAHFMQEAGQEIARVTSYGGSFTLIMLDVDHFKQINDTYGHPAGDAILREFAGVCSRQLRGNDLFGRIGGEEFAAGLIGADRRHGFDAAERIRKAVAGHEFSGDAENLRCTASFGVTAYSGEDDTLEQMLARADTALYHAKSRGRNCSVLR